MMMMTLCLMALAVMAGVGAAGSQSQGSGAGSGAGAEGNSGGDGTGQGSGGSGEQSQEGAGGKGFVGLSTDQAGGGASGQGDQGGAKEPVWELKADPTTVVAVVDGKPLTANDVKAGYMMQSDYTRKTTELSQQMEQARGAMEFLEENRPYLAEIFSGDPARVAKGFIEAAATHGVELVLAGEASKGPARGEGGRFTASSKEEDAELLKAIEEEHGKDSPTTKIIKAQMARAAALEEKLARSEEASQKALGAVTTGAERARNQAEAARVAEGWKAGGFEGDVAKAMALVGKPMTVEQAMHLANLEGLLRHNIAVARAERAAGKPNEPGGVPRSNESLEGKSLAEVTRLRMGE